MALLRSIFVLACIAPVMSMRPFVGRRDRRRFLQVNATACTEENEILQELDSLGNMNANDLYFDGVYFFFVDDEGDGRKDYENFFSCDEEATQPSCTYTELRDMMTPACEFYGGQMYSFNGGTNCFDAGVFKEIDLPLCVGPSCDVETYLSVIENPLYCVVPVAEPHQAEPIPFALSDTCREETRVLFQLDRAESGVGEGLGSGSYVFGDEIDSNLCCNITSTVEDCDFADLNSELVPLCEDAGGCLFSYDDIYTSLETTILEDGSNTSAFASYPSKNVPICVGASCDADIFFNQIVFPAFDYSLNSMSQVFDEELNATNVANQTCTHFDCRAVSVIPTDTPAATPTSATTASPTMPADIPSDTPTVAITSAPTAAPTAAPTTSAGPKQHKMNLFLWSSVSSLTIYIGVSLC